MRILILFFLALFVIVSLRRCPDGRLCNNDQDCCCDQGRYLCDCFKIKEERCCGTKHTTVCKVDETCCIDTLGEDGICCLKGLKCDPKGPHCVA